MKERNQKNANGVIEVRCSDLDRSSFQEEMRFLDKILQAFLSSNNDSCRSVQLARQYCKSSQELYSLKAFELNASHTRLYTAYPYPPFEDLDRTKEASNVLSHSSMRIEINKVLFHPKQERRRFSLSIPATTCINRTRAK